MVHVHEGTWFWNENRLFFEKYLVHLYYQISVNSTSDPSPWIREYAGSLLQSGILQPVYQPMLLSTELKSVNRSEISACFVLPSTIIHRFHPLGFGKPRREIRCFLVPVFRPNHKLLLHRMEIGRFALPSPHSTANTTHAYKSGLFCKYFHGWTFLHPLIP